MCTRCECTLTTTYVLPRLVNRFDTTCSKSRYIIYSTGQHNPILTSRPNPLIGCIIAVKAEQ